MTTLYVRTIAVRTSWNNGAFRKVETIVLSAGAWLVATEPPGIRFGRLWEDW